MRVRERACDSVCPAICVLSARWYSVFSAVFLDGLTLDQGRKTGIAIWQWAQLQKKIVAGLGIPLVNVVYSHKNHTKVMKVTKLPIRVLSLSQY